ncbi:hypothetical protein BS78_K069800 [Paspalum vaginatum]|uniref:Uncharacterized protein n=1 Tax=Paspalum vaginatum TaxID=158149 RepID=A0A9W8CGK1_9POAL|nr:hypothetical protein BS78_K069800 [Paspalum vaginatum]
MFPPRPDRIWPGPVALCLHLARSSLAAPTWADLVLGPAGSTSGLGSAAGTVCRRGRAGQTVAQRPPASPRGLWLEGVRQARPGYAVHRQGQLKYLESCLQYEYDRTFPIRGLYYDRLKGRLVKLDSLALSNQMVASLGDGGTTTSVNIT